MVSQLNNLTLNVLSAITVSVVIATKVRRDFIFIAFLTYAVYLGISALVPDGGQLNAAIALCSLLYVLFDWTTEDLVKVKPDDFVSQYEKVPVFDGYVIMNASNNKTLDTYDPQNPLYRRLSLSQNRMGGAQYTYTFWVNFSGAIDQNIAGKTLFMRGDKRKFKPFRKDARDSAYAPYFEGTPSNTDFTIVGPRVYFKSPTVLGVQVNTDTELVFETEVGNQFADKSLRRNALSLVPGNWAMFAIVVEDNVPIDDFANGVAVTVYINDVRYAKGSTPGSLRPNAGPLHVLLGDAWPANSKMSDLHYYNYALSDHEVHRIYAAGPNTKASDDLDSSARKRDDTLRLGVNNKLDNYNYDPQLKQLKM